jgi:hypothetical protein
MDYNNSKDLRNIISPSKKTVPVFRPLPVKNTNHKTQTVNSDDFIICQHAYLLHETGDTHSGFD